eukprot:CAMPEP_0204839706 /NCGR_PEP_ID=MMETSP1346-20131115/35191_1 /ASSEMBLY_ACC=CAM_ASM_000771 /TAXON_ID=215587 /ORGANISM="Aplanochytrium stocchinoi, Strain GSBS06" /LENGTH=386 /DNA_ID=CAMNT_0051976623 /DNA_START=352 /DNA_END=1512 /DNA_ORIENTATION=-
MALVWIGIPFSPSSHIFVTIGTLVAERLLYIPSIGFALLVARTWGYTNTRAKKLKRIVEPVLVVLIAWYVHLTISRVPDWLDDKSLFAANLKSCPQSAKSNTQYHQLLLREGNITGAKLHLEKARSIHPDWCDLDLYFGSMALVEKLTRDNLQEAVDCFIKSLTCLHTANSAMDKLQTIFIERKKLEAGGNVKDPSLYYDVGRVNQITMNYDQALLDYKQGILAALEAHTPAVGVKIVSKVFDLLKSGNVSQSLLQSDPTLECQIRFSSAKLYKLAKEYRRALATYDEVFTLCKFARPGTLSEMVQLRLFLLETEGETLENVQAVADTLARVLALIDGKPSDVQVEYLQAAKRQYLQCVSIASASREREIASACLEKHNMIENALS